MPGYVEKRKDSDHATGNRQHATRIPPPVDTIRRRMLSCPRDLSEEDGDVARLDGKVALVTGAGRGIGRATALRLAQDGAKVAVNYNSSAGPAQELVEQIQTAGGTALAAPADVSDAAQVEAMVA